MCIFLFRKESRPLFLKWAIEKELRKQYEIFIIDDDLTSALLASV